MTLLRFLCVRQQAFSFAMLCHRPSHLSCRQTIIRSVISVSLWQRNHLNRRRKYSVVAAAAAEKHYAVVGAGLAGLATAYHLLKQSAPGHAVHVTLIDAVGIGAGGSGAAAGLLHPFTPKGKLLWKAPEAMKAAVELLAAAEAAAALSPDIPDTIAWRTGMLRPASDSKQSQAYWRLCNTAEQQQQQQQQYEQRDSTISSFAEGTTLQSLLQASIADAATATQLVPHVVLPAMQEAAAAAAADGSIVQDQQQRQQPHQRRRNKQQQQQQQQQLDGWTAASSAALHITGGITLHPLHYMRALWEACKMAAAARGDGSSAQLQIQQLKTLDNLQMQVTANSPAINSDLNRDNSSSSDARPQFNAVVVAAGAAAGSIADFSDQLLISLCQGYTLDMVQSEGTAASTSSSSSSSSNGGSSSSSSGSCYGANSPSLLGSPYIASQGGQVLVVGATKQHNYTAQQAFDELARTIHPSDIQQRQQGQQQQQGGDDRQAAEVAAAADELLAGAAAVWPPIAQWTVGGIRTGVRALPPRTQYGSVPLAGKWSDGQQSGGSESSDARPPVWLLVGLGARGLVYHAWLGLLTAQAVLGNSEVPLPEELLAWRHVKASTSTTAPAASISEAQ